MKGKYKLPIKEVEIFGQIYSIHQKEHIVHEELGLCHGYCDNNKKEIWIELNNKDEVWKTFIHEFGHAVHYRCSLLQTSISPDLFEVLVDTMSVALVENFEFKKK